MITEWSTSSVGAAGVPAFARYTGDATSSRWFVPIRRAMSPESVSGPSRMATSTPSLSRSWRRSSMTSSILRLGCWSMNSPSFGTTSRRARLDGRPTRRMPWSSPVPLIAWLASSSALRMGSMRLRYSCPASVKTTARVERISSEQPTSRSSEAMTRETEGCGTSSSRPAREKLPVRATRTKRRSAVRFSLMTEVDMTNASPTTTSFADV